MARKSKKPVALSSEQQLFVEKAREGRNILVNACIGSGKTTAIQRLCDELPPEKKILYLTYNKLLKIDAKAKIKNENATVSNYHGFAYGALSKCGISVGVSDLIQTFIKKKPKLPRYDVVIIDEYQDIEQEIAELLFYVKSTNPAMQIIAVGDMEQKIYDKTTLVVPEFIDELLGEHIKLEFTQCFRLPEKLAARLGWIWGKEIVGVNSNCVVEEMSINDVVEFLSKQDPKDVLCLGAREGDLATTLNELESRYPDKYNKNTVYASISDRNGSGATQPKPTSAIFTTYDSSKGLERKICVIFDYVHSYWHSRIKKPMQSPLILRNIFCVAASRGKERIIFVDSNEGKLSDRTIANAVAQGAYFEDVDISEMFDFKYKEDVEKCYSLLQTKRLTSPKDVVEINVVNTDGLIDLSPCIGIFQEAAFFNNFDIDDSIAMSLRVGRNKKYHQKSAYEHMSLDRKILFLASIQTSQNRYLEQVSIPLMGDTEKQQIIDRLGSTFSPDEMVQTPCSLEFAKTNRGTRLFSAQGLADVVKDNTVYELKFVSELTHEHFLQCACYVVALGLERGVLWNTRTNVKYEVRIKDKAKYLDAVANAVTKGYLKKHHSPK